MKLSVWIEPSYTKTPWCHELTGGIRAEAKRRNLNAIFTITDAATPPIASGSLVLLAGETIGWFSRMYQRAAACGVRVCSASSDPAIAASNAVHVLLDRQRDMFKMVQYLAHAGRDRIVLWGINAASPADQKRVAGFLQAARALDLPLGQEDILYTSGRISDCCAKLLPRLEQYNAIIASNDLYAVYLLPVLKQHGVRVPTDHYLAAFGNSLLSQLCEPSLTTASLNHFELGRQAVICSHYLLSNPQISQMSVSLQGDFYARHSTECRPFEGADVGCFSSEPSEVSSYDDPDLKMIAGLEVCLNWHDSVITDILRYFATDQPFNRLAETLYISDSTLDYRLRKIYAQLGFSSRSALRALVQTAAPLLKDLGAPPAP